MTRKHLLIMAVCCTAPILALAAIFLFQVQISTVFLIGLLLLCPLLHIWMMRRHMGHTDHDLEHSGRHIPTDNSDERKPAITLE